MMVSLPSSALVLLALSCNSRCVLEREFVLSSMIASLRALSPQLECTFANERYGLLVLSRALPAFPLRHALPILACSCLRTHCLQCEVVQDSHVTPSSLEVSACRVIGITTLQSLAFLHVLPSLHDVNSLNLS